MEKKEYLNEENYQKNNSKIRKVGKILLISGIIIFIVSFLFIIFGFLLFGSAAANGEAWVESSTNVNVVGNAFGGVGLFIIGGVLNSLGFILMAAGGITLFVSHRREITAYTTQQVMPVAQEGIDKMAPTIGNAAGEIAKGIKKGINEADKNK